MDVNTGPFNGRGGRGRRLSAAGEDGAVIDIWDKDITKISLDVDVTDEECVAP
ncbi:hypothetical protein CLV49_1233 [Labedella gwakjiensis]|uniref:Uncharacterized protein n=1 Tax=Labedella gwakjiensis TaxID=390269 RepID=A0A2P8GUJ0_9MICO|nr:hypothetical protein [Labedella gwakjiensis]PSL37626.1 hypothetical protein CLV49_1233 [Labedella gwakjiensis]